MNPLQGVTFPCIHAVWSRWAPPMERSRMAAIAFAGNYAGTVISMPASGLLASYFGWESLFYVFGRSKLEYFEYYQSIHAIPPVKVQLVAFGLCFGC